MRRSYCSWTLYCVNSLRVASHTLCRCQRPALPRHSANTAQLQSSLQHPPSPSPHELGFNPTQPKCKRSWYFRTLADTLPPIVSHVLCMSLQVYPARRRLGHLVLGRICLASGRVRVVSSLAVIQSGVYKGNKRGGLCVCGLIDSFCIILTIIIHFHQQQTLQTDSQITVCFGS